MRILVEMSARFQPISSWYKRTICCSCSQRIVVTHVAHPVSPLSTGFSPLFSIPSNSLHFPLPLPSFSSLPSPIPPHYISILLSVKFKCHRLDCRGVSRLQPRPLSRIRMQCCRERRSTQRRCGQDENLPIYWYNGRNPLKSVHARTHDTRTHNYTCRSLLN